MGKGRPGKASEKTFRDRAGQETEARFPADFQRLRTELRLRHYSIRTEETYSSWARRFLSFHGLKAPRELGAEEVREYLEYLAVERKVSLLPSGRPSTPWSSFMTRR